MRRLLAFAGVLFGVGAGFLAVEDTPRAQFSQFVQKPIGGGAVWSQCINFRATSGAVTDQSGCAYSLGSADSGSYPLTPVCNGCGSTGSATSVGWHAAAGSGKNDMAAQAVSLSGDNFVNNGGGSGAGFEIDYEIAVPNGTYNVAFAAGLLNGTSRNVRVQLRDGFGGSALATVGPTTPSSGNVIAADNVSYTPGVAGTWVSTGQHQSVSVTVTSGVLDINITSATDFASINNILVTNGTP